METIVKTAKISFLVENIKMVFPKSIVDFEKKGFKNFEDHCSILLDYFESRVGEVPSEEADCIWHSMILYTKKYSNWCNTHFGSMIHHVPNDNKDCTHDTGNCASNCGF